MNQHHHEDRIMLPAIPTTEHLWRTAGTDGLNHAFRHTGGYLAPQHVRALIPILDADTPVEENFGPYDAHLAECAAIVPIAMLLPLSGDRTCPHCHALVHQPGPAIPDLITTNRRLLRLISTDDPGL